jgi:hypothetical protein
MAQRGAPDDWASPANRPTTVRITVVPGPGRRAGLRASGLPRSSSRQVVLVAVALLAAVAVAAAVAAAVYAPYGSGHAGAPRVAWVQPGMGGEELASQALARQLAAVVSAGPLSAQMGTDQLAAEAEAYRFPLGCLSITLSRGAPPVAPGVRSGPCWRYGVYMTAILHRIDGAWRLALEVRSPSCPRVSLPASVRNDVVVCRR